MLEKKKFHTASADFVSFLLMTIWECISKKKKKKKRKKTITAIQVSRCHMAPIKFVVENFKRLV